MNRGMEIQVVHNHFATGEVVEIPNGRWVAAVSPTSQWSTDHLDGREPAKERPANHLFRVTYQIYGVAEKEVKQVLRKEMVPDYRASITRHLYLVARKPFVVICQHMKSVDGMTKEVAGSYFIPARQVWKGELGQQPPIQDYNLAEIPIIKEGKRPRVSANSLSQLAKLSHRELAQLVRLFWDRKGEKFAERFEAGKADLISRGWALAILRLLQFGWQLEEERPNFTIEVPIPPQPIRALPIVPIEEMQPLRLNLAGKEAMRHQFLQAVEGVGITDEDWVERPDLSDPLNGFASRVRPRLGEAHNGRMQIILYYWTRAGSGRIDDPDEVHWMADISVHESRPTNPRVAPASYRLTIWPDQLMRSAPWGSVGGVTPPKLDPRMAESILQIVAKLGYQVQS